MLKTILCLFLLFISSIALAQGKHALERHVFPPELVMRFKHEIHLTGEQRKEIKKIVLEGQKRFLDLRWDVGEQEQAMVSLVNRDQVNEGEVLKQLDKILDLERQIKRTHVTMLIRIKNILTKEQEAKLREIKKARQHERDQVGALEFLEFTKALGK